ncbi:DGQHR domain-containing protein DpdB [Acetobacter fabarum]|uniref:DGQHR domain-containing protein DpdB n=1 Tax=Acetobacter fabarum TaxID=483199 RepID=UPI0020A0F6C9|nr:DGQHR domain-containing protein DpdB [Acetobacter fabarum]MCP1228586.1 DGQHR domain-containing protein [Acetobacter fabarum]MCP1234082.1 DGQHR domain-containing protein [Acetobacter fabarum]
MTARAHLSDRAIRAEQGQGTNIFTFFLHGADNIRIADISRIHRDEKRPKGFQRGEIRAHVSAITEFLDSGAVLFPNAIILVLSPGDGFTQARGRKPGNMSEVGEAGTLTIPHHPKGRRAAWIVDGQQRSLALSHVRDKSIAVPVVGFVSDKVETQRAQFILVNKAKPLPTRLINELLPEVSVLLPRDLAVRQLPSALCEALDRDPSSPFHGLVRRESTLREKAAIVTDTALIEIIRQSLRSPVGALGHFRHNGGGTDTAAMYDTLLVYWKAVREAFPDAWGRPPTESRLMHSAGIRAMGALMDPIMLRADSSPDRVATVQHVLQRLAPHCHWTEGCWSGLDLAWNAIQSTSQHISRLTDHMLHLERDLAQGTP